MPADRWAGPSSAAPLLSGKKRADGILWGIPSALDRTGLRLGAYCPEPVRETLCGVSRALSVKVSEAVAVPTSVGLKVMLMVQKAPGARGPVQLLHLENELGFDPVSAPLKFRVAVPLLVSVTCCAALVVFTFWLAKVSVEAERVTAGAVPLPESATN